MEKKGSWVWFGLTLLLSGLILAPTLWFGFGADQGIGSYGAWLWKEFGQPPYAHFFDQSFPGIFLLHYFIQAFLGESVTAFRLFDLIWQTLTALMIYLLALRIFKSPSAGLLASAFFAVFYLGLGPWNTGERDGFMLLPYLAAFLFLLGQEKEGNPWGRSIAAGLLMGAAFLIKPVAVIPGVVLAAMTLRFARSKFLAFLLYSLSAALPSLLILAYYGRIGRINDLYRALFVYTSTVYLHALAISPLQRIGGILILRPFVQNFAVALGFVLFLAFARRPRPSAARERFWLLGLAAAIYLAYLAQGKYFVYQQMPVFALVCIFSGAGWGLLLAEVAFLKSKPYLRALVIGALILASLLLLNSDQKSLLTRALRESPGSGQRRFPYYGVCKQAADYLKAHTRSGDIVQVWGGEVIINYLAKRRSPTRLAQSFPFTLKASSPKGFSVQKQLAAELLRGLEAKPPVYFLVITLPHPGFGIESDKDVLIHSYPEIWSFVANNYLPETRIGFVEFYRREESAQKSP